MLRRSAIPMVALLWATASFAAPAVSEERSSEPSAPVEVVAGLSAAGIVEAPAVAEATEHLTILVEGKSLSVRARQAGTDDITIDASPIFEALNSRFEARE